MAKCPKCESDVPKPFKTWSIHPYKNEDQQSLRNAERIVGMFACSNCGTKFRKFIETKTPT